MVFTMFLHPKFLKNITYRLLFLYQGLGLGNQKEISDSPCIQRAHVLEGTDIGENTLSVLLGKTVYWRPVHYTMAALRQEHVGPLLRQGCDWQERTLCEGDVAPCPFQHGDSVLSQLSSRKMYDYSCVYMRVCVCTHV